MDLENPTAIEGKGKTMIETNYNFLDTHASPQYSRDQSDEPGCCRWFCCNRISKIVFIASILGLLFLLVVMANNNADSAFRYAFTVDIHTNHLEGNIDKMSSNVNMMEEEINALKHQVSELETQFDAAPPPLSSPDIDITSAEAA